MNDIFGSGHNIRYKNRSVYWSKPVYMRLNRINGTHLDIWSLYMFCSSIYSYVEKTAIVKVIFFSYLILKKMNERIIDS